MKRTIATIIALTALLTGCKVQTAMNVSEPTALVIVAPTPRATASSTHIPVITPSLSPTPEPTPSPSPAPIATIAPEPTETATEATGQQTAYVMQINIPRLGLDTGVEVYNDGSIDSHPEVFGPDGPHFPDEAGANVCIGAHRTIKTHLFHDIHTMVEGDRVYLTYGDTTYKYSVVRSFIVDKMDWSFTSPTGTSTVSLMACHPMGSSSQRYIVQAELIS